MSGISAVISIGGVFQPTQFSGLQLWFDASNANSITSSGGAVSQWNDLSGNANNLTQGTSGLQPTIQSAAQNGLNTLLFVRSNSQQMGLANSIPAANNFSEFFVARLVSTIVWAGNISATGACSGITTSSNTLFVINNDGSFSESGSTFTDTLSYHLYEGLSSGTNASDSIFYDRAPVTLSVGGGPGTLTIVPLNGFAHTTQSGNCDGYIGEYIRYNNVLSSAQRQTIENYLHNKWGTP